MGDKQASGGRFSLLHIAGGIKCFFGFGDMVINGSHGGSGAFVYYTIDRRIDIFPLVRGWHIRIDVGGSA